MSSWDCFQLCINLALGCSQPLLWDNIVWTGAHYHRHVDALHHGPWYVIAGVIDCTPVSAVEWLLCV